MPSQRAFPVGARVRVRRGVVHDIGDPPDEGIVVRSDPRGVLVDLDSGQRVICDPRLVTRVPNG